MPSNIRYRFPGTTDFFQHNGVILFHLEDRARCVNSRNKAVYEANNNNQGNQAPDHC